MKNWKCWMVRNDRDDSIAQRFTLGQRLTVAAILLFAIFGQLWCVSDPYWLAFETGFQELIARRHLDLGLSVTHGLSTLNNLGPEPVYHATHPPLLQLTLAGLYELLGESEAVARIIPMTSFWAMLAGIWILTRDRSSHARICSLAAAVTIPLSFCVGRIVNFEAPVLACIVMTMVCVESLNRRSSWQAWCGLVVLGIGGTLIDWPYPLFVLCLFLLSGLRIDRTPRYMKGIRLLWILSMGTACVYVLIVQGIGIFSGMVQHAKLQTGLAASDRGYIWPPILVSFQWWKSLLWRLTCYGTPVFMGTAFLWLFLDFRNGRLRRSLDHGCVVLLIFGVAYIGIFSRASHNHLWTLFYISPFLSLAFGLVVDRIKPWIGYVLIAVAIAFASPFNWDFRHKTPLRDSVLVGRSIEAAMDCMAEFSESSMKGPLLYVNRVDPLAYYARCETAFSHLSVLISKPEMFLIYHRPEFVVLSDLLTRSSITVRPEYPPELWERLKKSYTLIYQLENIEVWESLESPHLSILGMLQTPDGSLPETRLVDDKEDVHIGVRVDFRQSPLVFDLRAIPEAGQRWLHGWVIAFEKRQYLDPIAISVQNENGLELGTIHAIPQKETPRWQEFWLPIGDRPEKLRISWDQGILWLGDMRLMNEVLWAKDLTRVLATEIRRSIDLKDYQETVLVEGEGKRVPAVLQHPGFGIDSVDLPPMRIGLEQRFSVKYGLSSTAYAQSDGVIFRLYAHDYALDRRDLLFEDFIDPKKEANEGSKKTLWHTQNISLMDYSRHMVVFSFEVDPGPEGNLNHDHALWRDAQIDGQ